MLQQLVVGKKERERERDRTTSVIERESHRCDVMVWASLSHSHGIRLYCLPWFFVWFSILGLQQLVVEEREREREREKERTIYVMTWSGLLIHILTVSYFTIFCGSMFGFPFLGSNTL